MFKERAKAGKSALGPAILLIVFMYVFYIIWGIAEILIGINPIPIVKHLILWSITGYCAYILVSKYVFEYEFTARKNEFTVTRISAKKIKPIVSLKYENITELTEDEEGLKEYKFYKKSNLKRAFQTGKTVHMVYEFDSRTSLMTICVSREMLKVLRDNIKSKKEQEQI